MLKANHLPTKERHLLEKVIEIAKTAYQEGNYPVGAILTINGEVIESQSNQVNSRNSWVHHAEAQLIIKHSELIKKAAENEQEIILYSSLEPCLMCLGMAAINKIKKVIYIQHDPHGGACNVDISSLGVRYRKILPKIKENRISDEPKQLIISYLKNQIVNGNKKWAKNSLKFFNKA